MVGEAASKRAGAVNPSPIRVVLVEDHKSFRHALSFAIELEPDIVLVAEAGSIAEARRIEEDFDVALVDLGLPDGDGADLIRELRAARPDVKVLVLTARSALEELARAVEAGAAGVLHKSAQLREITDAVRRVNAEEYLFSQAEMADLFRFASQRRERDREAQVALNRLTPRELEVLQALAYGLQDREIAERLHMSDKTARTHVMNITKKLGVHSRLQALVFALSHGVVKLE